jgi:preprotein translocase subunit YajC
MISLLVPALVQQAPAGGQSPLFGFMLQIGLIFAIFYFLMIRPQQKQRRAHEERLRNLRKGDAVVTSGGIVGEVVHLREAVKDGAPQKGMDDHVTIKSGESRFVVERRSISRVEGESPSAAPRRQDTPAQ